jgi:hypothetical protein
MVIKRATWPAPPRTAGALLKASAGTPVMDEGVLDRLETIQRGDEPPEIPWRDE